MAMARFGDGWVRFQGRFGSEHHTPATGGGMAHGGLQGKAAMGNPQGGSQRGGLAQGHHAAYDQQPSTIYHYDTIVKIKNKKESLQKMADGEAEAPASRVSCPDLCEVGMEKCHGRPARAPAWPRRPWHIDVAPTLRSAPTYARASRDPAQALLPVPRHGSRWPWHAAVAPTLRLATTDVTTASAIIRRNLLRWRFSTRGRATY